MGLDESLMTPIVCLVGSSNGSYFVRGQRGRQHVVIDNRQESVELPPSDEQFWVDVAVCHGAPYRTGVDEGVADDTEVEAVPQHGPQPCPAGLHFSHKHISRGFRPSERRAIT